MQGQRSDGELVAASLDGDHAAFGELVDRHGGRLHTLARRLLGEADAEDLTQETLLHAYLGLDRLRDPDRFASWAYAIALNLARMRLRDRRNGAVPLDETLGGRRLAGPPALEPSAEELVETREVWRRVQRAVDVLPAEQRRAVLLHYVDGLSCEEIAALLGEPAGTVRVRLHRARARLRDRLSSFAPTRREVPVMVEVTLEDVIVRMLPAEGDEQPKVAGRPLRIVLLREKGGDRLLPIWIGAAEGDALAFQLTGGSLPRPLTPDLTARLLEASGGRIERVTVNSLRDKTFYSVISLSAGSRSSEIDARPSDALNLAARVGAPIYVAEEVMAESAVPADQVPGSLDKDSPFGDEPEGEWRSLSAELLEALHPPWPGGR